MASSENHGRTVNEKSTTQTAQAALSERVDTLAAELDIERQRRHQLETALDAERTARKQLERDLKDERTHRKEVDSLIEALRRRVTTLSDSLFGADGSAMAYEAVLTEYPPLIEVIEQYNPTAIEALEADLQDETDRVAADTAKLRRELHLLAGEVDVDLTDSAVCGDDKITRVIRNGPEAVETTVNPVDRRAAAILSNIDRWGQRTTDAYGERFVLTARIAKDRLQDTHGDILARRKRRGFLQGKPRVEGGFRTETPQASSVRVSDSACGVLWRCHNRSYPVASHRLPVPKADSLPTG